MGHGCGSADGLGKCAVRVREGCLLGRLPSGLSDCTDGGVTRNCLYASPIIEIEHSGSDCCVACGKTNLVIHRRCGLPLAGRTCSRLIRGVSNHLVRGAHCLVPLSNNLATRLSMFSNSLTPLALIRIRFSSISTTGRFATPS